MNTLKKCLKKSVYLYHYTGYIIPICPYSFIAISIPTFELIVFVERLGSIPVAVDHVQNFEQK